MSESNPVYYDLGAGVVKFRRLANKFGSIAEMPKSDRRAYAEVVEKAIRAKQRAALVRELPSFKPNCASGTAHTTGEAIHNAVREQQRTALLAAPSAIRKARSKSEWRSMYAKAMQEKHATSVD